MQLIKLFLAALMLSLLVGCSKDNGGEESSSVTPPFETGLALGWVGSSTVANYATGSLVEVNLTNGNLTMLKDFSADLNTSNFMVGADVVHGRYIALAAKSKELFSFDSAGKYEILADYSNEFVFPSGLAYVSSTNRLFLSDYDGNNSILYEVNATDYSIITSHVLSPDIIIGIACDVNGTMYGVEISNDTLVSIDIDTGGMTTIGSLGVDINYAQDIAYDRITNRLYGALYGAYGALYSIDIGSGTATEIAAFSTTDIMEITAFAIVY